MHSRNSVVCTTCFQYNHDGVKRYIGIYERLLLSRYFSNSIVVVVGDIVRLTPASLVYFKSPMFLETTTSLGCCFLAPHA